MITIELDDAVRQLSKILKVGYVDFVDYDDEAGIVTPENRDFNEYFKFDVKKQVIRFPSTSELIEDTVKTVVEVRELITTPKHLSEFDDCILTILRETGEVES